MFSGDVIAMDLVRPSAKVFIEKARSCDSSSLNLTAGLFYSEKDLSPVPFYFTKFFLLMSRAKYQPSSSLGFGSIELDNRNRTPAASTAPFFASPPHFLLES